MAGASEQRRGWWSPLVGYLAFFVPVGGFVAYLAWRSSSSSGEMLVAMDWFDQSFFLYNLVLAAFAVLIIPSTVYFYCRQMRSEKVRRLKQDMGDLDPEMQNRLLDRVQPLIVEQFRFRNYLGSLCATGVVVAAGALIILLMKPYFPAEIHGPSEVSMDHGVDFGRGANILMAGPSIELLREAGADRGPPPEDLGAFYHRLVISLIAFQFGFLGAYIYFITSLLRSYFTLDLSSHTLVAGTIRMVVSSVLALVLSFVLPTLFGGEESESFLRALPVLAFFLGYFPRRGLLWLERWGNRLLGLGQTNYQQTPLTKLSGMSSSHEPRLEREGFDNVENLAHADPLDLAVRTGFGYRQLRSWISEARLRAILGPEYDEFVAATWLRTRGDLVEFFDQFRERPEEAIDALAAACQRFSEAQLRNLLCLVTAGITGSPGDDRRTLDRPATPADG